MARTERWVSIVLLSLTFFVGVSACFGGVTLLSQGGGTVLEKPVAILERTPFESFAVPGLLLLLLGVVNLLAAWAVLARWSIAWLLAAVAGVGVVVWTTVQLGMIGYVSFLQPVYAALGIATVILAVGVTLVEHRGERELGLTFGG